MLILIAVFVCVDIFNHNDVSNSLLINEKEENNVDGNVNEEDAASSVVNADEEGVVINDSENVVINDSEDVVVNDVIVEVNDSFSDSSDTNYNEEDVVSYFENMEIQVSESTSFKEKFKEYFIIIVDFIFYDGEIKGYTFDELSGTAKAKIISIALKIDSKIEGYVPNYKETISSTSSKIYTDIKAKLVTAYLDISTDICKNNEDECNKVKEIFGEIKDACSIGWEFIKGLLSSGVSKLKDWYEIYSGK